MPFRITRRELLFGLAASATLPAHAQAPSGSARYLLEAIFFRQPGPPPKAVASAPLQQVATIPGRVELLPETGWQLGALEAAFKRRTDYELLAHALWAAIVPANGRTTARLDEVLPAGIPLAGSIAFSAASTCCSASTSTTRWRKVPPTACASDAASNSGNATTSTIRRSA